MWTLENLTYQHLCVNRRITGQGLPLSGRFKPLAHERPPGRVVPVRYLSLHL